MWISRKAYNDLHDEWIKAHTECGILANQNRAYETTIDWFRVRITQLEHERAALLNNYLGVNIPTPTIERAKPMPAPDSFYHAVPHFNDMGDDEAKTLGVGWHPDGTLKYSNG